MVSKYMFYEQQKYVFKFNFNNLLTGEKDFNFCINDLRPKNKMIKNYY